MRGRTLARSVDPTAAGIRARGGRREHDGSGSAVESDRARAEARKRTLACKACGSLVDKDAARRAAIWRTNRETHAEERRGDPKRYARGDGCGARTCSTSYREQQYICRQEERIAQVSSGERTLIAWQTHVDDHAKYEEGPDGIRIALVRARAALYCARRRIPPYYLKNTQTKHTHHTRIQPKHAVHSYVGREFDSTMGYPGEGPPPNKIAGSCDVTQPAGRRPISWCPDLHPTTIPGRSQGSGATQIGRRVITCPTCHKQYTQRCAANLPTCDIPTDNREARWVSKRKAKQPTTTPHVVNSQASAGAGTSTAHAAAQQVPQATGTERRAEARAQTAATMPSWPVVMATHCTSTDTTTHAMATARPLATAKATPVLSTQAKGEGPHAGDGKSRGETPPTADQLWAEGADRPHVGDEYMTYGNMQGGSNASVWEAYLHTHILQKASAHGGLETAWTAEHAKAYANDLKNSGKGRLYSAEAQCVGRLTERGTGCVFVIGSDIPIAKDEEAIYRHTEGKALAIHITWHRRKLLILLMHCPHNDREQAAFYEEITSALRAAYRKLNPANTEGDVPPDREVVWMADHNHVTDPTLDCRPERSYSKHPKAVAARIDMERYLRAPADAYRHFNPKGKSTTHDIQAKPERTTRNGKRVIPAQAFHQARIDAINLSASLTEGQQRFVKAEHIAPQHYGTHWKRECCAELLHKQSDHSLIRLTYRTTSIPRPKREPAFASEIMHSAQGRNIMRQVTRTTLYGKTQDEDPAQTQAQLAQQWKEASIAYRKEQQGTIRRNAARASHKVEEFIKKRNAAVGTEELGAWQAQLKRAEREYNKALEGRQRMMEQRRMTHIMEESRETAKQVHGKIQPKLKSQPVTEAECMRTDSQGNAYKHRADDIEGIHEIFFEHWKTIAQCVYDEEAARNTDDSVLERIRIRMQKRVTDEERSAITMEAVLTVANIRAAIKRVKAHTAPGQDGIPIEPYTVDLDDEDLPEHLIRLYQQIQERGRMPDNMRESTTTMAYKGKDTPAANPANYRPIAVTATEYRILATAMAQRLAEIIHRMIGDSQIGFQIQRDIGENIDLMEETLRYANNEAKERGGAIAILDNAHAFDYIARPFMWRVLEAFGIPECFIGMLKAMMNGITTRLKINDTLGPSMELTSGLRQGCPLSSMLFLLVMEVLLTLIREDKDITGIEIPNADGDDTDGHRETVCERSLADDLAVYMSNIDTSIPALRAVLARFQTLSGQRIKIVKSAVVLLGKDANRHQGQPTSTAADVQALWPGMLFSGVGLTVTKYHGIELSNLEGAEQQWRKSTRDMIQRIDDDARVFRPRSVQGRAALAEARYIGKVAFQYKYHVPTREVVDDVLSIAQKKLDTLVIGKRRWIRRDLAIQRKCDGGIALPDIRAHMGATWAYTIHKLLEPEQRQWKNFGRYYIRRAYGARLALNGNRLITANYSWHKITQLKVGEITEKMRQAFLHAGGMPRLRDAGTQVTRAPPRQHSVLYYVCRRRDSIVEGIGPATHTATKAPPTTAVWLRRRTRH